MKLSFRIVLSIAFLVLAAPLGAHAQSCSQTLNPGDNVALAAAAAPNGSTVCLNAGDYGNQRFTNIRRSDFVTLRSTTGVGARMRIDEVYNSNFLKFDSLTFNSVSVRECSTDIHLVNSTWVPGGGGLAFHYTTSCPQTDMRLLVDKGTFTGVGRAHYEGRLSVAGVRGLTIRNSLFNGQPANAADASDGLMLGGSSTNVTVGPGNVFRDIVQAQCGTVHCDAIQMYDNGSGTVITGNYFVNNSVHIGNYDGGSANAKIVGNIFDGGQGGQNLQIGGIHGMLMEHNTFRRVVLGIGTKFANTPNAGWVVQNNIFDAASFTASGDQPGCGSDCVTRYNLKSNGGSTTPAGTNNITGTAIYVGTGSPSNWTAWQLATASPGKNAASDGKDMGVVFSSAAGAPVPPTGLVAR